MTKERQRRGRAAEEFVARRLERAGWCILDRNCRPQGGRGELDIVARHGREIVFVEVKARSRGAVLGPESPTLAVGPQKQARLRRLAAAWLTDPGRPREAFGSIRFDVAGVWMGPGDRIVGCEYLKDAF